MFDHLLESSRWDDSNKPSNIGFTEERGIIIIKIRTLSGAWLLPGLNFASGYGTVESNLFEATTQGLKKTSKQRVQFNDLFAKILNDMHCYM